MSIDRAEQNDRRDFMRTCGCALAGIAVVGVLGGCEFTHVMSADGGGGGGQTVEIDVSALTTDDTGFLSNQRGPDDKRIAIVRRAGAYRALSVQCTHSQFPVALEGSQFYCTGGQGHDSRFDLDGTPLTGPALTTGPLRTYPSSYDEARKVLVVTIG